ncbi:hypothetical protein LV779_14395 [Streptomyces thinghirensis]|nr:hypothetical protein [Streptomyces thinghirensis]
MADPHRAEPHRSAHVDTFAREHLPPPDQWPELRFDLPELRYPARLNCAAELLTGPPDDRPVFRTASGDDWTYGRLRACVDRLAHLLTGDLGVVPGNRVLLRGPHHPVAGRLLAGGAEGGRGGGHRTGPAAPARAARHLRDRPGAPRPVRRPGRRRPRQGGDSRAADHDVRRGRARRPADAHASRHGARHAVPGRGHRPTTWR